jgi:hypothetical protein
MNSRTTSVVLVFVCDDPNRPCVSPSCLHTAALVVKLRKHRVSHNDRFWCVEHWKILRTSLIRRRVAIRYGKGAPERIVERINAVPNKVIGSDERPQS